MALQLLIPGPVRVANELLLIKENRLGSLWPKWVMKGESGRGSGVSVLLYSSVTKVCSRVAIMEWKKYSRRWPTISSHSLLSPFIILPSFSASFCAGTGHRAGSHSGTSVLGCNFTTTPYVTLPVGQETKGLSRLKP